MNSKPLSLRAQVASLSAELADVKQRAREERRQLSLELASTRTEATAAAARAADSNAALTDAQGVIEELTARLKRRATDAYWHSPSRGRLGEKLTDAHL